MIEAQFPAPIVVGAVQVSVVPVLVVPDAASAVGALGVAVQAPGPLLPLQDARKNRALRTKLKRVTAQRFFLRGPDATKQMPKRESPIAAYHTGKTLARRTIAFAGGVVVIVSVV